MSSSPNQQKSPTPPPAPPTTAETQNNNNLIAPSTSSSLNTENNKIDNNIKEYNILLIGIKRVRKIMFDQLKQSAQKYEQHNHYSDICYLTFEFKEGEYSVLELMQIDPRTTRTGAHLMGIRKAHAAIICYAAHIPSSFHVLTGIAEDFNSNYQSAEERGGKGKGKIAKSAARPSASLLLCDNDVLIEEDEDKNEPETKVVEEEKEINNKPLISRLNLNENEENLEENEETIQESPKINTNNNQISPRLRRPSMEKIVKELDQEGEDWLITREKGEQLANIFGPDCQFKCFSFSALKAEQDAVMAEGLNDSTFIVTIIDQLIKRAEEVKSGKNIKNSNNDNNNLRRRSNSPTNLNSRRLSPLSTNLKRMLQGGTKHLKGGGNAVVQLISKKNNTNEENINNENKKTSLSGMRRLFSRQKSEERVPVKSGSTLSLPNSQQIKVETQQQQPIENGKPSQSTSIFGKTFRALTQPREHFKQRNNKIASTVPIAGNDVDNPITVQPQQQPPQQSKKSLVVSTLSTNTNNIDIVQIQPPTGEIGGEPFNFNEKDEEEQQKEEEEEITKEQQNGEKEDKIEQDDQRNEEKINEGQKEEAEEIQKEPQEETTTKTTTNRFKRFAKQSSAACIIQ